MKPLACPGIGSPTGLRLLLLQSTIFFVFLPATQVTAQFEDQNLVHRLHAPPVVDPRSDSVVMRCEYDLQGKDLYSVNWYKGDKMLYSWRLQTKGISFPNESDVDVNLEQSNGTHLVIRGHRDAIKNAATYKGTYFCEVSTEKPFLTGYAVATIATAIVPEKDPVIEGVSTTYHVGDQLDVNCTSAPSLPAAELLFYVNYKLVEAEKTRQTTVVNDTDGSTRTKLSLSMRLEHSNFPSGSVRLSCRATYPGMKFEREYRSEKIAALAAHRLIQELPSIFTSSAPAAKAFSLLTVLFGLAVLL